MAEQNETGKKKPTPTRSRWLYIGSVVILVLVVVTFVGAPAVTSVAGSGQLIFGRYDGVDIAYQPGNFFARQYDVIARSLADSRDEINLDIQLRLAWREAFNRTVLHTAVLQTMDATNARVSERRVDERIAQDPRFQENGRFDARAYADVSNQERFALRRFHRETALFNQFVTDVLTGPHASTAETDFVAAMSGPERSFNVVRFPFSAFPEDQVAVFGRENSDLFAQYELSVVTLATEDEGERVREQALTPGNPIADLARTYSRDLYASQDGSMGRVFGYELQQELVRPADLETIAALDIGTISPLIETTSGWSFYELQSAPTPFADDDPEALAAVRQYMQAFEQGRIQDYVRAQADAFVAAAQTTSLDAAAAAEGLTVASSPFFPINYGNLQFYGQVRSNEIPDLADAAFREPFFETAFSLEGDEISEPILLRQSVLVLQLREEREALEEDIAFITRFYGSLTQDFRTDAIETAFVDEDRLDDRFASAFNRYVLGN